MKLSRANAIIVSLACLTVISLAGSSLGTLAWYAYTASSSLAYSGTAVRKTEQLQIGLLWGAADKAADAEFEELYPVSKEVVGDHSYYFMPVGSGFTSPAINYYLTKFGHATNELPPLTSRAYESGAVSLWESPTSNFDEVFSRAESSHFVELPFVFRVYTTSGAAVEETDDGSVDAAHIWLTDAIAQTDGEKDVSQALRIHINNLAEESESKQFILNPSAVSSGDTVVAGLLDLNGDGYYDYKRVNGVDTELVYGDKSVPGAYVKTEFDSDDEVNFADVNDTGNGDVAYDPAMKTTFYGRHHQGVYGFTDLSEITRSTAHYLSFADITPNEVSGQFSGEHPMATTSVELNELGQRTAIGRATLQVWLEGWDHAIVDSNIGAHFNLGLQFEIDRV